MAWAWAWAPGRGSLALLLLLALLLVVQSLSLPAAQSVSAFSQLLTDKMRTVLSDVDGTLLDSKHNMQGETVSAIRSLMEAGFDFFPCTGRSRQSMATAVGPQFISLFGSGGIESIPGVYQQGLQVYGRDGVLIFERLLPQEVIVTVEAFCAQHGVSLIAYSGATIFTARQTDETRKIVEYKEPVPTLSSDVAAAALSDLPLPPVSLPVHKLILLADDAALDAVRPLLEQAIAGQASITKAVKGMLEVLPFNSNKGAGVEALLRHLGTAPEHTVSFGDGENDKEMLALVGLGVAVSNARPELKQAARLVLGKSNDEQAVAECLRELVAYSRAAARGVAETECAGDGAGNGGGKGDEGGAGAPSKN